MLILRTISLHFFISLFFFFLVSLFSPHSTSAQSTSHTSRLSLPIGSGTTVVVENKQGTESTNIVVSDYLSSTKVVIDEKGTVIQTPEYYPYGDIVPSNKYQVSSNTNPTSSTPNNNSNTLNLLPDTNNTDRLYTGQRKVTDDSPVYNYNARYYNPDYGLFIQPDTVEGINRYSYVNGNPIMNNDPTGHSGCNQGVRDPLLDPICNWFDSGGTTSDNMYGLLPAIAVVDTITGGIASTATWIGDKIAGNMGGTDQVDEAYASLSGGTAMAVFGMGMASPDPGDAGKGLKAISQASDVVGAITTSDQLEGLSRYARAARLNPLSVQERALALDIINGRDSFLPGPETFYTTIDELLVDTRKGRRVVELEKILEYQKNGGQFTLPLADRKYIFAVTRDNLVIVSTIASPRSPHSSLIGGRRAAVAGEIKFKGGRVEWVSTASGHYRPGSWRLTALYEELDRLGIEFARGYHSRIHPNHNATKLVDPIPE